TTTTRPTTTTTTTGPRFGSTTTTQPGHGTPTTTTSTIATTTTTIPKLDAFLGEYDFVGNRTSGPCGVYPAVSEIRDAATAQMWITHHDRTTMGGSMVVSGPEGSRWSAALISRSPGAYGWPTWIAATNNGTCGIFIPYDPK